MPAYDDLVTTPSEQYPDDTNQYEVESNTEIDPDDATDTGHHVVSSYMEVHSSPRPVTAPGHVNTDFSSTSQASNYLQRLSLQRVSTTPTPHPRQLASPSRGSYVTLPSSRAIPDMYKYSTRYDVIGAFLISVIDNIKRRCYMTLLS
ncbi:UNVERIFIED_CONTAM: hypothetical protein HDU68_009577 [Siphonaria sp. JEL0065]|nr:hypothetical protein HDU68_009577 [Siphonaria sp. JEL0065]